MRSILPGISFLCVGLLAVFVPVARVRCNVANLAIVAWLIGSNLVHGVNAFIWADNVDIHVPAWCDIVTKLLIGASMALPGACLCISRRLELVSSSRPIHNDPRSQTRRILFELLMCYIIPLLYMAFHFVTQDHRFDLVKDYGCSASVHPSGLALTLMWLPPSLLCFASFILSGLAIHHSFRIPAINFSSHITSRSPLTSSIFTRRVIVSIITSGILFIVNLFSVFSVSEFRPWISWSSVHATMSVINVIQSKDNVKHVELVWWGVPAVSLVYILLSFTIGEESRDAFKWIQSQTCRISKWRFRRLMVLPLYAKRLGTRITSSRSPPLHETPSKHVFVDLKSGWDDMLDTEPKQTTTRAWFPERKSPNSLRTVTPITSRATTPTPTPTPTTPTPPASRCDGEEDQAFIMSTLDYLDSPAAKALGIKPLLMPPPPIHVSRGKPRHDSTISPTSVHGYRSSLLLHNAPPSPRSVPTDVESVISSVFDASWPQPPPSPPRLTRMTHHVVNRNCSCSNAQPVSLIPPNTSSSSSTSYDGDDVGDSGVSLYSTDTAPTLSEDERSKPFQGSSVSPVSSVPNLALSLAQRRYKRSSPRSLRRSLLGNEKLKLNDDDNGTRNNVIYMTVVKESF